jgi:malonyl-CoA O-methyltransferase
MTALIRRSFEKAASTYDEAAVLQRHVGAALVHRLDALRLQPTRILEIGCATGFCTQLLSEKFPNAQIVALDIAMPMLYFAKKKLNFAANVGYLCANAASLPFADNRFDLIFSNLTLQWLNDVPDFFAQCRRLVMPGGYMMMTTLGPQTLHELRVSWEGVDAYQHVNEFKGINELGDQLLAAQFQDPVCDVDDVILRYRDLSTLFQDLKGLGATSHGAHRPQGLMGKQRWQHFIDNYQQFRESSGHYPASYQVVYVHGFAGKRVAKQTSTEEASFPISELRRRVLHDG